MRMNCSLMLCLLSLVVLVTGMAVADTQVQFYDQEGNLITDATLEVMTSDAQGVDIKTALPADPDGTYDVPVEVGEKANFKLYSGSRTIGNAIEVMLKVPVDQSGPLPIIVSPMTGPNDLCPSPQPIPTPAGGSGTAGAVLTPGSTLGKTLDGAPFCGTSNTAAGVWYTVTGNGTWLTASTCETNSPGSAAYDTKISVYCQDCAALTCVAGNDDSPGCNFRSTVSWCAHDQGLYRILVHGFGTETGAFVMSLTSVAACTTAIDCLPPLPRGACCVNSGGIFLTCIDDTTEADCTATCTNPTNTCVWGGMGTTCVVPINERHYVALVNMAIPDATPAGITASITVTNSGMIADLNVDIGISHTWVSDLIIRVTNTTTNTTQVLWNQVCGSTDNINATADDSGLETLCAPINAGPKDQVFYPPSLAGDGPLSLFNGEDKAGVWTINVSDNFAGNLGTLNQWSLHFIEGAQFCPPFDGGGAGGAGGTGCPDDEDDDEDEDSDQGTVETEDASTGTGPLDINLNHGATGNQSGGSTEKGGRGRVNRR